MSRSPNLPWGDTRPYAVQQRTSYKDCSGALQLSSRVLRPSLVTLSSHKSGRCAVDLYHAPNLSETLRSIPILWLPVLSSIEPPTLRKKADTDKLVEKIIKHDSWPIQPDILSPPFMRLTSRKPLWLDLQPADIKSRWRHNWKSAQPQMWDPTIRQPGFDLPRQQWSLLNRFRTKQGHCGARLQKEMATCRH